MGDLEIKLQKKVTKNKRSRRFIIKGKNIKAKVNLIKEFLT
jgi:hypothetical protein